MTMKTKLCHADVPCVDQVAQRQTRASEHIFSETQEHCQAGQTMSHHPFLLIKAAGQADIPTVTGHQV